ncbi:hypothetical protein E4U41_000535 [Claviceps citrina]|nr:hypothetical protein E4U41_000535 [Claviceps citrina]
MACSMLVVSLIGLLTPDGPGGTKDEPVGIAIVFSLFLVAFFYMPSWGATPWMWTAEIFSMNVRAQAVGMCTQMQNVANTIFQQFFPLLLQKTGLKCLFFFMAMNVALAAFVYFFIPETRGIALEEIDVLFGEKDHTARGAQLLGIRGDDKAAPAPAPEEDQRRAEKEKGSAVTEECQAA